ncbi:MAG: electron transfer flavoprotein subunit beta/FixA family protein [Bacteroidetes bacterium]|nr:electron transfer flavoprotein subunit beta/FixA family protein [Bacteroidota bacterium]
MTKPLKIVVLAKQVPDTRNVGKDAMKEDGTVNRAALEAIYNPEDLNALEQAIRIKEKYEGTTVTVLTMGPPRASDIIRESIFRGANDGILLTDRAFAGSDTLATSYALSCAIRKINPDIVIAGRQAIDGDTAQVGPQVAEKLNFPQITYVENVESIENGIVTIIRRIENGIEKVEAKYPLVLTINESAPVCRPRNARRVLKYRHSKTATELQAESNDYICDVRGCRPHLTITEWGVADIDAKAEELGMSGSPTKVKSIQNVVFQVKDSKILTSSDNDVQDLMQELIANHTIG